MVCNMAKASGVNMSRGFCMIDLVYFNKIE